jgi:hypothetical protein
LAIELCRSDVAAPVTQAWKGLRISDFVAFTSLVVVCREFEACNNSFDNFGSPL